MHSALLKLILLHGRGLMRRGLRGAGSPRRAVLLILGLLVFVLWLGPSVIRAMKVPRSDPNRVRAVTPLALLGICMLTVVTSAGDKAISFTPGEVDLLFAAPFTRRELLAYKLTKSTLGAGLTALVLSLVLLHHAQWWPACCVGIFLTLLFVQFFSITMVLMAQTVGTRVYSRARQAIVIAAIAVAVLGGRYWLSLGSAGGEAALMQLRRSSAAQVVFFPLEAFGQTITARNPFELAQAAGRAIVIDLILLLCVVGLDASYIEAAMAATRRRSAHVARIRGGSMLSMGVGQTARWRMPPFPWLGGAGPIAWRQAAIAARSSRGLLLLMVIVAIGAAPGFAAGARSEHFGGTLIGVMAWLTFLVSGMLKFDFRGDVDQMENLKALPLSPRSIVVGQLVVPVGMLTVIHVTLLLFAASILSGIRVALVCAAALALPFNALLFAIENLTFLLYPTRPAAVSPGDFQVLGRQVVVLAVKLVTLLAASVLPAISGAFGYVLTGGSFAAGAAVAGVVLAGEAAGLIPIIAWAYGRFDPSVDTPA